jgi:THO complex subunit 2
MISHRVGAERPPERPPTYGRHDSRSNEQYGRLDRPGEVSRDAPRDLIRDRQREASPGHRSRGRTPEGYRDRREPGWGPHDPPRHAIEPRDPHSRDIREVRDIRDARDPRELLREPREHGERGPPRPPRELVREGRSDHRGPDYNDPRSRANSDPRAPLPPYDDRGRQHLPSTRPPAASPPSREQQGPLVNPERMAVIQQATQSSNRPADQPASRPTSQPPTSQPPAVAVNPGRLALIEKEQREASRKAELSSRLEKEKEASRNNRSAREKSPRRQEDTRLPRVEASRDDRRNERFAPSDRPPLPPQPQIGREKREDTNGPPPLGPRSEQVARSNQGRVANPFQAPSGPPRPQDPNHGRLGFDPRQDPNYGRLNSTTEAPQLQVPQGPRSRGNMGNMNNMNNMGRGGRNFTGPQPPGGPRGMQEPSSPAQGNHIPPSPSQDRAPPSGPSSDRRGGQTAPASAPHGPAADQQSGLHPSRMQNIVPPPLQISTGIPTGPANHATPATSPFPPSGPRGTSGHRPSPSTSISAPSPTGRNPPSGPLSANDRRQKDDVRFQSMKNILIDAQTGNNQGASIRGRAANNRMAQQNTPQSPIANEQSTPTRGQDAQAPQTDPALRPDLMLDRPNKPSTGGADAPTTSSNPDERSDGRGGRRRESGDGGRSRRHRSRSPRRDAAENIIRQREEPPTRGDRERSDRKAEGTGSDRDERGHRRSRGSSGRDSEHKERSDKDREGSGRERSDRDRDGSRRESRGGHSHTSSRPDEASRREPGQVVWDGRGQPPPPPPPPPPGHPPNGESRRGGDRRDDRRRDSGRDRKRGRNGGDEGAQGENKRIRRDG